MDLPAWREENIAKRPEENDKKLRMSLVQIGERERERERKVWKTFEKWVWTSQTQFLKNPIHNFQLIDTDRGSLKIFKTISIDQKIASIDRNSGKNVFLEK